MKAHSPDPGGVSLLRPGENCWRIEHAARADVIIDAATYFRAAREAMLQARQRIMLIGWDFDARIELLPGEKPDEGPARLGDFILWLVRRRPELEVFVLRWDIGAIKTLFRGTTLLTLLRWKAHPRITARLDGAHPAGGSLHLKILVLDDCLAFCGGIDMTAARWDTREHLDDEPRRAPPTGAPEKPWHDATTALEGPIARAIGDLARERWRVACGEELPPIEAPGACWPASLSARFHDIEVGIARTRPEMPEVPAIHEIERLYLDLIASARRHIYAESQYFASRRVAEALARRLEEPDGPEIVLVNPLSAQGWLEPVAMDTARARLREALRRHDRYGRFRIYHPETAGGRSIYVHAKMLVVDDHVLRVGSSNLNNRSMRLDVECDVVLEGKTAATRAAILSVRNGLIAEHLGRDEAEVAARIVQSGSMIATIEAMRGEGRTLRPYETPALNGIQEWLADNEILDPEGPGEIFEPLSRRGLFRHLRWPGRAGD